MKRISSLLLVCLLPAINAYGDGLSAVVTQYGASCDGTTNPRPAPCASTTDDTCGINNALVAVCGAPGGGEVVIPPGTCLINPVVQTFNLCSNLTIRGSGRKSLLQVRSGSGTYSTIFGATAAVSNVVIKDFRVDQNPAGNSFPPSSEVFHVINLPATTGGVSGISVSGMFFDPTDAIHTIHAENNGDLRATVTNNYFNFNTMIGPIYRNTAVYLEGSQQVVTGNTFLVSLPNPLSQNADTAIETHGGRSTVSNNSANNYMTLVNVVPTSAQMSELPINNVVVSNNSVTCAQNGVTLTGVTVTSPPQRTLRNVSITGNTIHICSTDRSTAGQTFAGVRYDGASPGDVDGLVVSSNVISMQSQSAGVSIGAAVANGGILLHTAGNLANVVVNGNIVTNSPVSGIRIGTSCSTCMVQRVRVTDNTIVDAGNNSAITASPDVNYRHAIGLWGNAKEVDVMRNMIFDTKSDAQNPNGTFGLYALYLNQTANPVSKNIRTSQNTVRISATGPNAFLRTFQTPDFNAGLVDATNANDIQISTINVAGVGTLNVDFMSFTRYITTISGSSTSPPLTVVVPPPSGSSTNVQWTVGQLVTFRFRCANLDVGGCLVQFDPQTNPNISAYSTNGDLSMNSGQGLAITFQVESFSTTANTRRFFELYRSPQSVAN